MLLGIAIGAVHRGARVLTLVSRLPGPRFGVLIIWCWTLDLDPYPHKGCSGDPVQGLGDHQNSGVRLIKGLGWTPAPSRAQVVTRIVWVPTSHVQNLGGHQKKGLGGHQHRPGPRWSKGCLSSHQPCPGPRRSPAVV